MILTTDLTVLKELLAYNQVLNLLRLIILKSKRPPRIEGISKMDFNPNLWIAYWRKQRWL